MWKGSLGLIIAFFIFFCSSASERPVIKECIVMLDAPIAFFLESHSGIIEESTCLSPSLKIYLLKLKTTYEEAFFILQSSPSVLAIQKNNLSHRRFIPNDALYPNQYQLKKMGLEQAWDGVNTGLTGNNDTIVIAVIDDGLDVTNPELKENVFINYNEIPNDGIDNDTNGYVDDYKGWNSIQHSDSIFDPIEKARHGSLVTGVIGAKGNNSAGITGVNMNVKYLAIVGGITDADIIESYDYIMSMKKLYMETKGARGAYIVASNSSFGRDRAREEDAPLWCAMYDSMGKYGVISMGATSNTRTDVDVAGDLPSDCSSNFTVIVTDVNDDNQTSGYGPFSVDIGAFGSNTLSTASRIDTANNGWYKRFSGTSAATPYVTGAIGLLYSNACQSFLNLHDRRPDSAALMAKYFVLEGIDKTSILNGKVKSGGTLNVDKMLQKMEEWCLANLTSTNTLEKATILVYPNPAKEDLHIKYSENTIEKIVLIDQMGRVVLTEILANVDLETDYSISIESLCNGIYTIKLINSSGMSLRVQKIMKN